MKCGLVTTCVVVSVCAESPPPPKPGLWSFASLGCSWEAEQPLDIDGYEAQSCLTSALRRCVMKEYHERRHWETKHRERPKDLEVKQRLQTLGELKEVWCHGRPCSDVSRHTHRGGIWQKTHKKVKCDVAYPEFLNVSLSRNTDAHHVNQLNCKSSWWPREKICSHILLLWMRAMALSIPPFISGVDSTLCLIDVLQEVSTRGNEMGLPWGKVVGQATDGAPAMTVKRAD